MVQQVSQRETLIPRDIGDGVPGLDGLQEISFSTGCFFLSPMLEQSLYQTVLLFDENPPTLVTRPISCGALVVAALLVLSALLPRLQKKRKAAITEDS
jgi:TctA family transporter